MIWIRKTVKHALLVQFFPYIPELPSLQEYLTHQFNQALQSSFAPGTAANLKSQWKQFILFALHIDADPCQFSLDLVKQYIMLLAQSLNSYQTLKNYLSSLKLWFTLNMQPADFLDNITIRLCLQAVKRKLSCTPQAKLPITPAILKGIRSHLDLTRPFDAALWASFLLAFYGMLRKASVVPKSPTTFNRDFQIAREAITFTGDDLVISLKRSKSNQFGDRYHQIPIAAAPGSSLDPVEAYKTHIDLSPASPEQPAFTYRTQAGYQILTHYSFVANLKSILKKLGLQPELYSGHSFRRGSCSTVFSQGISTDLIKHHGLWLSSAYQTYLTFSWSDRLSVTQALNKACM